MDQDETLICDNCGRDFLKAEARSCGNCFVCRGCEIYECPYCRKEIVIKPMPNKNQ